MTRKDLFVIAALAAALAATIACGVFWEKLQPPQRSAASVFEIHPGDGARGIAAHLAENGIIRSPNAFLVYATLIAEVRHFQTGIYMIPAHRSAPEIVGILVRGENREVSVTIPEGSAMFDIDSILAEKGVLRSGDFIKYASENNLEGRLFPDTYRFFLDSSPEEVARKMESVFDEKIAPLLPDDPQKSREKLILASILEKEVSGEADRQKVAGILIKRIKSGMALHVDATICYGKRLRSGGDPCYPVTPLDTRTPDPYNTYLNTGWPPGPIGNPGIAAVKAALSPVDSPYWYYLSDPSTKQTIFSKTLEEHETNRSKYLLSR